MQVCSVTTLVQWFILFEWLRIFETTAIWVMMIENTLYDILPFMSLVFLVICAFGNAIFVLDHYEKSQEESGVTEVIDSPIPIAFHNDIVDSWVN